MEEVIIYTDGGCRGNGKESNVGAIGVVIMCPKRGAKKEYKEAFIDTTNNQMEMLAVIKGLEMLKRKCSVTIKSDSSYVVNAFNNDWISSWKRKGWTRGKEELKNKELWQRLYKLSTKHNITFVKVKGHSGDYYNDRCDELANIAMDGLVKNRR